MKNSIYKLVVLFILLVSFNACKEDGEGVVKINYNAKINSGTLAFNQPYVLNGDTVIFKLFKFYTSNIQILDKDDQNPVSISTVHLVDYFDDEASKTLEITVPATAYKNPSLTVGLSDDLNETDPSLYSSNHPLSAAQGNYWMMASSYIFFKIEGFRKVNGVEEPIVYHVGFNGMGKDLVIDKSFDVHDGNTTNINITVDFDRLFSTIDFDTEGATHTTDNMPLAEKMMDNFVAAIDVN